MKKLLIPLLLVIVAALVIGCTAGQEEISDEAIDAELEQLSDEELLDLAVGEEDDGASVVGEAYRRYSSYTKSRYKASAKKKVSRRLSSAASVFTPVIFDFSKSGSIALKNDLKLALDNDEKISLAIGENGKPTIKLPDGLSNSCAECTIGVCCGNDPQCLNGPVCKKCVSC